MEKLKGFVSDNLQNEKKNPIAHTTVAGRHISIFQAISN